MIEKVHLEYFKSFTKQSFDLTDNVVLAGSNNAGKTTLLQAIATWHFAYKEWHRKREISRAKKRRGIAITRKEFLSVPVQRFNLLWTNSSTALSKSEGGGKGAVNPRIMRIILEGKEEKSENGEQTLVPWKHTMEFRYSNPELIYVQETEDSTIPEGGIDVVYVPSFSGIETEEKVHTPEYQEWLIGQGKSGDIIRNLLADVSEKPQGVEWKSLVKDVKEMFGDELLKPQHAGRPFILCEYFPNSQTNQGRRYKLDIASAGSGFLQVLLLLAFSYARPSTVFLIDEPDAHLHIILQKQIYEHLQKIARKRNCQMIIATHSEVVIDNTSTNEIISFYGEPHRLSQKHQRDAIREALKRLTSIEILQADSIDKILYVEDNSDLKILHAWAERLNHPLKDFLLKPFYYRMKGNNPTEAKSHFFALKAVNPNFRGVLLLDGDNRNISDHDVSSDGLMIFRWERYEIENYLIHPQSIERFAKEEFALFSQSVIREMHNQLSPAIITSPLENHPFLKDTKASTAILPIIVPELYKQDYYKIAHEMKPDEIHPEVKRKLDEFATHWGIPLT